MEFKKLLFIIWRRKNIFVFVLFSVIFLVVFWFFVQPSKYNVVFYIDVSRENYQETKDYRYDQFYRLQADEKFSDTIVHWINGHELIQIIHEKNQAEVFFVDNLRAERLSSDYIKVSFETKSAKFALVAVNSIKEALNLKIAEMNNKANDPNWFIIIVNNPIISMHRFNFKLIILGAILMGIILGIFASLFHYYWKSNENWN